jgi:hypothetical protein
MLVKPMAIEPLPMGCSAITPLGKVHHAEPGSPILPPVSSPPHTHTPLPIRV